MYIRMFIFHLPVINAVNRRNYIRSGRGDKAQIRFFLTGRGN